MSFAALLFACPSPPPEPQKCVGGIVLEDGTCVAKCDPTKCLPGNTCVDNQCVLSCTNHAQCDRVKQECLPDVEDGTGKAIFTCQARAGTSLTEHGEPCPKGDECGVGSRCLGSGEGDVLAYCTTDCSEDVDCPSGFECGVVRDPRPICGNQPNEDLCGKTTEACVDSADITPESGLVAGAFCLQRKTCLKRDVCAPCQGDPDCSWSTTLTHCVQAGADMRCAPPCNDTTDCDADKQCTDGHCTARAGTCASGGGFCTPCRFDTDCGENEACIDLYGNEKACMDLTLPFQCTKDTDCPLTPGDRHGTCLTQYNRCYAPFNSETNTYSCY